MEKTANLHEMYKCRKAQVSKSAEALPVKMNRNRPYPSSSRRTLIRNLVCESLCLPICLYLAQSKPYFMELIDIVKSYISNYVSLSDQEFSLPDRFV